MQNSPAKILKAKELEGEGKKREEIAALLGVSRRTVSNMLTELKRTGEDEIAWLAINLNFKQFMWRIDAERMLAASTISEDQKKTLRLRLNENKVASIACSLDVAPSTVTKRLYNALNKTYRRKMRLGHADIKQETDAEIVNRILEGIAGSGFFVYRRSDETRRFHNTVERLAIGGRIKRAMFANLGNKGSKVYGNTALFKELDRKTALYTESERIADILIKKLGLGMPMARGKKNAYTRAFKSIFYGDRAAFQLLQKAYTSWIKEWTCD